MKNDKWEEIADFREYLGELLNDTFMLSWRTVVDLSPERYKNEEANQKYIINTLVDLFAAIKGHRWDTYDYPFPFQCTQENCPCLSWRDSQYKPSEDLLEYYSKRIRQAMVEMK